MRVFLCCMFPLHIHCYVCDLYLSLCHSILFLPHQVQQPLFPLRSFLRDHFRSLRSEAYGETRPQVVRCPETYNDQKPWTSRRALACHSSTLWLMLRRHGGYVHPSLRYHLREIVGAKKSRAAKCIGLSTSSSAALRNGASAV